MHFVKVYQQIDELNEIILAKKRENPREYKELKR